MTFMVVNTSNIIATISEVICQCIYRIKLGVSFPIAWLSQGRRIPIPRRFRTCRSCRQVWILIRATRWKKKGTRVWGISFLGSASPCLPCIGSMRSRRTSQPGPLPTRRLFFASLLDVYLHKYIHKEDLINRIPIFPTEYPYRVKEYHCKEQIIRHLPSSLEAVTYYPYIESFVRAFPVGFRSSLHIVHVVEIGACFPERWCDAFQQPAKNRSVSRSETVDYSIRPKQLPLGFRKRVGIGLEERSDGAH